MEHGVCCALPMPSNLSKVAQQLLKVVRHQQKLKLVPVPVPSLCLVAAALCLYFLRFDSLVMIA